MISNEFIWIVGVFSRKNLNVEKMKKKANLKEFLKIPKPLNNFSEKWIPTTTSKLEDQIFGEFYTLIENAMKWKHLVSK